MILIFQQYCKMAPLEVDYSISFILLAVNCLVQKNRQVKRSLCPGKKDTDLLGLEPPTSDLTHDTLDRRTRCPVMFFFPAMFVCLSTYS